VGVGVEAKRKEVITHRRYLEGPLHRKEPRLKHPALSDASMACWNVVIEVFVMLLIVVGLLNETGEDALLYGDAFYKGTSPAALFPFHIVAEGLAAEKVPCF